MLLQRAFEFRISCFLDEFWQGFGDLRLRVIQIAQLVDEQIAQAVEVHRKQSHRGILHSKRADVSACEKGWTVNRGEALGYEEFTAAHRMNSRRCGNPVQNGRKRTPRAVCRTPLKRGGPGTALFR